MKNGQIEYIQKYLNIDKKRIFENLDLINDLIFYKKENQENSFARKSKLRAIFREIPFLPTIIPLATEKSIYDLLECTSVDNYEYPENKKFAVCLTHDIDYIYPPFSHDVLSFLYYLKNLELGKIKNQFFWKYEGKEKSPYWNFDEIMKLEEKHDAKSSFYFMATEEDIRRFRYDIEDLENTLGSIVDNGWEVGLHGGYNAYNSLETILKEKKRIEKVLGKKVIGYRNHYLMFKVPDTWKLLAKAGFKYDTTFGYNNIIGFRNGMCHPYHPFDLDNNQEIDIIEIPLNIMDMALFNSGIGNAWDNIKKIIDNVEKFNGVLTILWHNNIFNCPFRKDSSKLYNKLLSYCHGKNAWMTSGDEILEWWINGH
jgi:peptidoglycan/xylan/chitin deacetylase (PgdA/CDA1 family)